MKLNKLKIYLFEFIFVSFMFFALFFSEFITRYVICLFLFIFTILLIKFTKNRAARSLYEKQSLITIILAALIYESVFYALGLFLGFQNSKIKLSLWSMGRFIIPITIIIVLSEIVRHRLLSQDTKLSIKGNKFNISPFLIFISMVLIDIVIYSNINAVNNIDSFLELAGFVLFSSLASNLFYNYYSSKFSISGLVIYRLIISLLTYIIPVTPDLFILFRSFIRILYPFILYLIYESTYCKKNKVLLYKNKKNNFIFTTITIVILTLLVMLISCQFKYGIIVIGSGSMTGTINKGDGIIYERYENQQLEKGQIIMFDYNNIKTVHRIIKISEVNGEYHYYTKGDFNGSQDSDYREDEDIIGIVRLRVKYIGLPTLWFRDLFK